MPIRSPSAFHFVSPCFVSLYVTCRYGIQSPSAKPVGLFLTAWMSASRWMSESDALRIIPSGSIVIGCRYTAPISMPPWICCLPIGYSAAEADIAASAAATATDVRMNEAPNMHTPCYLSDTLPTALLDGSPETLTQ